MRKLWHVTWIGLRVIGWFGQLVGLVGLLAGMLALFPVMFLDMATLGWMRPASVVWLRDVLALHYSLADILSAVPVQGPALWDHICFAWTCLAFLGLAAVGWTIMMAPILALLMLPSTKSER
jgi:hypothetical protein